MSLRFTLYNICFMQTGLSAATFSAATLSEATLSEATLSAATFSDATLSEHIYFYLDKYQRIIRRYPSYDTNLYF
jgi:uncharacterized protein YjbI with pentapeptide repeats